MKERLEHLLAQTSARHPHRTAVYSRGHSITYIALYDAAQAIARELRTAGVRPGDAVGIYLSKSIEAVAAIFAVLECRAAYVPLDPNAPAARMARIIADAEITTLVGDESRLRSATSALEGDAGPERAFALKMVDHVPVLTPFALSGKSSAKSMHGNAGDNQGPLSEDAPAYILYTSGSTGTPRGVVIHHSAALAFVNWAGDAFKVGPEDVVSSHAPLHFDLSVFDIFASIRAGAAIVLIGPELSAFPRNLATLMAERKITIWYSVPSALTQLILRGGLERYELPALRLVLFAGEIFPLKYLRRLRELWPRPDFHNLYGPTETNVCTAFAVDKIPADGTSLPIGRACAGNTVFALNDKGEPAAQGESGELHVRGPTLMAGYRNAPDETRAVLFPDSTGRMVYRTGDIVMRNENGDYLFVGRRDDMIKSRGYRIEPREIEAVLDEHPDVEKSVVLPLPHEEFGYVPRAVIVLRPGANTVEADILRHCARHLPAYMLPGEISLRDSLPLTSTGKVDKRQIPKKDLNA